MTEIDEVVDGVDQTVDILDRDRRERRVDVGVAERDSGESERLDECEPLIRGAQIGEEHAIHPTFDRELAVRLRLERAVRHRCQHEGLSRGRQLSLDAGDERREERIAGHDGGVAAEHETEGEGPIRAERTRSQIGRPAHLLGDRENAVARLDLDAGTVVERERHEPFADTRPLGDIRDRRPSSSTLVRLIAHLGFAAF